MNGDEFECLRASPSPSLSVPGHAIAVNAKLSAKFGGGCKETRSPSARHARMLA